MPERPDIFLLTIDALRADHLSCYGYSRQTPFFNTLAEDMTFFESAFSVSSHTREAMPPLLSGYRPERFAANGFVQVQESETLAGRLRSAGYQTGGFHSNPYLSRAYGFDTGFDEFFDDLLLGQNKFVALAQQALNKFVLNRGEYYARAPEINRRSLEWFDTRNEPAFLWNHYMDPHGPYCAPERHYAQQELSASDAESLYRRSWKAPESITEDEQKLLLDSYDDEIRYLDSQLESFFDELRERGLLADALVIVTADHGDAFGEHGYYTHPRYLHEELIRIPLFVSLPGSQNQTVKIPVSTIDIVPTILESAQVGVSSLPGNPLQERLHRGESSSVDELSNYIISSATTEGNDEESRRFAIRTENTKVTFERISDCEVTGRRGYDLKKDPDEQEPIAISESEQMSRLSSKLEEHSKSQYSGRNDVEDEVEVSTEIEDRLEALGYKE